MVNLTVVLKQIDLLSAKIQSRIAKFLMCRETLVRAQGKGDSVTKNKINVLLKDQGSLEKQLPQVLEDIDKIKSGDYSIQLMYVIGQFYYSLENHIKAVGSIGSNSAVSADEKFDISNFDINQISDLPWKKIFITAGVVYLFFKII